MIAILQRRRCHRLRQQVRADAVAKRSAATRSAMNFIRPMLASPGLAGSLSEGCAVACLCNFRHKFSRMLSAFEAGRTRPMGSKEGEEAGRDRPTFAAGHERSAKKNAQGDQNQSKRYRQRRVIMGRAERRGEFLWRHEIFRRCCARQATRSKSSYRSYECKRPCGCAANTGHHNSGL